MPKNKNIVSFPEIDNKQVLELEEISPLNRIDSKLIHKGAIDTEQIAAGAITATEITDGAITTPKLAANAVTAAKIAANTITADEIAASTITATEMNVSQLSAISADLGTITAGSIDASLATITNLNASNINTGTLTAITMRTAASGTRVEISASTNTLSTYDSSGDVVVKLDNLGVTLYAGATEWGEINKTASSGHALIPDGDYLTLEHHRAGVMIIDSVGDVTAAFTSTAIYFDEGLTMGDPIHMNSHEIDEVSYMRLNTRTDNVASEGAIWYYSSGGTYGFRTAMSADALWQIDQTAL